MTLGHKQPRLHVRKRKELRKNSSAIRRHEAQRTLHGGSVHPMFINFQHLQLSGPHYKPAVAGAPSSCKSPDGFAPCPGCQ